jgi:DNA-binding MarR family transcriptional regulator
VHTRDDVERAVDELLAASRALVGIAARALPESADVTLPQWRALVLLEGAGQLNVNALAAQLGVNPSTCTRLCDRLVRKGLLDRDLSPDSRREVLLRLTPAGSSLVADATARRRAEIEELVNGLSPRERRDLASALPPLVRAAGEAAEHAWVLGWAD